jgi:hypothetical protein
MFCEFMNNVYIMVEWASYLFLDQFVKYFMSISFLYKAW